MPSPPSFLVVGCGAVGGVVAAHLLQRGASVTIQSTPAGQARARARGGLSVVTPQGAFQVDASVVGEPSEGQRYRYVVLTTQGNRAEEAARRAAPFLDDDGVVVVCQNGLCEERVARVVGGERVVGAVVGWGARLTEAGTHEKMGPGGFTIGQLEHGGAVLLDELAAYLRAIGPVKTTDNLRGARWSKLALNCAVSGLGTVLGDRMGLLLRSRLCRRLALEVMTEAVTVALAEGVRLEPIAGTLDPTWVALTQGERRMPVHPRLLAKHMLLVAIGTKFRNMRSSMLRAIEAGNTPGVDMLNGEVVERGRALGIPTPYNARVRDAVEAVARGELPHGMGTLRALRKG